METKRIINVPFNKEQVIELKAGDYVYLTGTLYSARDAAHKRLYDSIIEHKNLPLDLTDNIFYYLGPTPAKEGQVITYESAGSDYMRRVSE